MSRQRNVKVNAASCLIVNTKGGGHAFIGYHLAKELRTKGHQVTIMNDGDASKIGSKTPYSKYYELERDGVTIMYGNPKDPKTYPTSIFDVVYDNNGKDMESCKQLIDTYTHTTKHYVFVASAGAYKANSIEPCVVEGDARKSSAGHVEVENYLVSKKANFTIFQPAYIYGPETAKDCEQWFVDRIVRDRPVCLPEPGVQLTSLTHVEDVASMLAAVIGNKKAIGQQYNICSDRAVTFQGIVKAIAKSLGKEPNIVMYSPEKLGLGKSGKAEGFPFRTIHFFASSDKAKRDLGWQPKHNFLGDVDSLVASYMVSKRQDKVMEFPIDDKILSAMGVPIPAAKAPVSASFW